MKKNNQEERDKEQQERIGKEASDCDGGSSVIVVAKMLKMKLKRLKVL